MIKYCLLRGHKQGFMSYLVFLICWTHSIYTNSFNSIFLCPLLHERLIPRCFCCPSCLHIVSVPPFNISSICQVLVVSCLQQLLFPNNINATFLRWRYEASLVIWTHHSCRVVPLEVSHCFLRVIWKQLRPTLSFLSFWTVCFCWISRDNLRENPNQTLCKYKDHQSLVGCNSWNRIVNCCSSSSPMHSLGKQSSEQVRECIFFIWPTDTLGTSLLSEHVHFPHMMGGKLKSRVERDLPGHTSREISNSWNGSHFLIPSPELWPYPVLGTLQSPHNPWVYTAASAIRSRCQHLSHLCVLSHSWPDPEASGVRVCLSHLGGHVAGRAAVLLLPLTVFSRLLPAPCVVCGWA